MFLNRGSSAHWGHRELPGGSRDGRENDSFKLPGQIKKIVFDLTMKTTTYSRQTSPRVSTIHIYIYTHHVNKTINLVPYNDRKIKTKASRLPYAIVSHFLVLCIVKRRRKWTNLLPLAIEDDMRV